VQAVVLATSPRGTHDRRLGGLPSRHLRWVNVTLSIRQSLADRLIGHSISIACVANVLGSARSSHHGHSPPYITARAQSREPQPHASAANHPRSVHHRADHLVRIYGGLMPCPSAIAVLLICIQIKAFALGSRWLPRLVLGSAHLDRLSFSPLFGARASSQRPGLVLNRASTKAPSSLRRTCFDRGLSNDRGRLDAAEDVSSRKPH
jgi:hypothetical protein